MDLRGKGGNLVHEGLNNRLVGVSHKDVGLAVGGCCLETELMLKGASAGTLLWAVQYLLGRGASLMRDVHLLLIGKDFPWNDEMKAEIKAALVELVQKCPRLAVVDASKMRVYPPF